MARGTYFTPEVGSQGLVNYEHGLPEMPVVVGTVFHPSKMARPRAISGFD